MVIEQYVCISGTKLIACWNIFFISLSVFFGYIAPILNVSLSSDTSTVLDISGYNSFTLHCEGKVSPIIARSKESFSFTLTKSGSPVTKSSSCIGPVVTSKSLTISQNCSSVQQNASLGSDLLVYNCTVGFSVNGFLVAIGSSTKHIFVRGELNCMMHCMKSNQTSNRWCIALPSCT